MSCLLLLLLLYGHDFVCAHVYVSLFITLAYMISFNMLPYMCFELSLSIYSVQCGQMLRRSSFIHVLPYSQLQLWQ